MFVRKGKRRTKNPFKIFAAAALAALALWLIVCTYATTMKTIRNVAQSEMENVANAAIHTAVRDASMNGGNYTDLVNIYRDQSGRIQSLTLDTAKANRLKSDIALKTLQYLNERERSEISIPIGNFTGSEFLSGIGPEVKLKIIPCNIANIDFESSFTQAGINQVRHTITVRVNVNIGALLPKFEEMTDLTSSAVVAEAVIIGDVPDTYLNIGGNGK